jgi:uncharacterized protein
MKSPNANAQAEAVPEEADLAQLQGLLEQLPPPLQPLDISALDGFLCGLLLQPNSIEVSRWMPWVIDIEGRAPPVQLDTTRLQALAQRRLNHLQQAIGRRQWFNPWIFELEEPATPSEAVLPWVAGFASAMERFADLMHINDARLLEPLALLYMHFDPDDLEDAAALQQLIETLEPPEDLDTAVHDIVRSLMLMADVVHPAKPVPRGPAPRHTGRARRRR